MYCKICGKQIADDSKFCKYCGALVDDSITPNNYSDCVTKEEPEIIISTKKESPVKIEIAKKETIKKSTVANEIVANIKMIGIAFAIWIVYVMFFFIVHQKDIRPMNDNSWFGESCYDHEFPGGGEMSWERKYALKLADVKHDVLLSFDRFSFYNDLISQMSPQEALDYANDIAMDIQLSKELKEEYIKEAKEEAQENKEAIWDDITRSRRYQFKEDLRNNMKWGAVITLSLTILGRYVTKFVKWVAGNRT